MAPKKKPKPTHSIRVKDVIVEVPKTVKADTPKRPKGK
jgi:hypothetical protein